MFKAGERVRWRSPLDADYSYGVVVSVTRKWVVVRGYYAQREELVHLRYIEKVKSGGRRFGGNKKHSKRSAT